jgi:hypothetical protein
MSKVIILAMSLFALLGFFLIQEYSGVGGKDKKALNSDLEIWALGDPHIHTDSRSYPPHYSMAAVLEDMKNTIGATYDFGIIAGDIAGRGNCPDVAGTGSSELLDQFNMVQVDRNLFYPVAGNHDASEHDASWFRKWVDPLGENVNFSGVDNNNPNRKNIAGEWDHYSFTEGNILFLMISDNNFGGPPFGRRCDTKDKGYPAGNYSEDTFNWWKDQVEQNRDKIIVTVAHHALLDTTMNTGFCDGWANGSHGAHSWADRRGSSIIYAIGEKTIDGLTSEYIQSHRIDTVEQCYAQPVVQWREYGFKKYLEEHPGAIDLWLHGHTHGETNPDYVDQEGRGSIVEKDGVIFVNVGAVTTAHQPADVPYSRLLGFTDGTAEVRIRTFLHRDWDTEKGVKYKGFYLGAERIFTLKKYFSGQN